MKSVKSQLKSNNYNMLQHLSIQLIVLFMTMNTLWENPEGFIPGRIWIWLPYFLMIDVMIYTNMYFLVPRFLLKGKTWHYVLSFPLLVLFAVVVIGLLQIAAPDNGPQNTPPILGITSVLSAFVLFVFGLTALQLFKYRIDNQRKIGMLENATLEVELANLQTQFNPHFLFNMLNNANIMAGEDVEKSAFILSKLNELLHYQIDDSSKKTVKLCDDIAFLEDYLALEKTRRDCFEYSIRCNCDCVRGFVMDCDMDSVRSCDCVVEVPPLLFIPFIENAVKHNPENDSFVEIVFKKTGNKLCFTCVNPKPKSHHAKKEGGIGLVNIRKRMDLLFGHDYRLDLKDESDFFKVEMEFMVLDSCV